MFMYSKPVRYQYWMRKYVLVDLDLIFFFTDGFHLQV